MNSKLTIIMIVLLGILGGLLSQRPEMQSIYESVRQSTARTYQQIIVGPTPTLTWHEYTATLSAEERAKTVTFFPDEFTKIIASSEAEFVPTTTPVPYVWRITTSTPIPVIGPTGPTGMIQTIKPTDMPSPTAGPSATPTITLVPTPTLYPTKTPTVIPTITRYPTPTPSTKDSLPPTVTINGGPIEGATIQKGSICFPLWVVDNLSWYDKVKTRMKVDAGSWTSWNTTYEYCPEISTTGNHTIQFQAQDEAGNTSTEIQRTVTTR